MHLMDNTQLRLSNKIPLVYTDTYSVHGPQNYTIIKTMLYMYAQLYSFLMFLQITTPTWINRTAISLLKSTAYVLNNMCPQVRTSRFSTRAVIQAQTENIATLWPPFLRYSTVLVYLTFQV